MREAMISGAEEIELSPENTLTDMPLSAQTYKPQLYVDAEERICSPKGDFSGKLFPAWTPSPHKQVSAEKRALSSEDAVDDKQSEYISQLALADT